ncbi:MAG: hypothetical protein GYB68_03350 [Chloroflexi bacterium]|nr:hypothetical protein [Chloroflexota bacterium]
MKRFSLFMALLLAAGLAACGGAINTEHGSGATITVSNTGQVPICFVQISPVTDDAWGNDETGRRQIEPGEVQSFSVAPGDYDLLAANCGENDFIDNLGVSVQDDYFWEVSLAAP